MLYSSVPEPVALTTMVPVGVVQVGCVSVGALTVTSIHACECRFRQKNKENMLQKKYAGTPGNIFLFKIGFTPFLIKTFAKGTAIKEFFIWLQGCELRRSFLNYKV